MAERYDIIVDFAAYAGKNITMRNNRNVQADEDYNSTDKVMKFIIANAAPDQTNNGAIPSVLGQLDLPTPKTGVDRTFRFERSNGEWVVNGVAFSDVNK
jgi:bilirubin oxidase